MSATFKIPTYNDFIAEASRYKYIREASENNSGLRVEAIQRWAGATPGHPEAWCAAFVSFVLDQCYQGDGPFPRYRGVAEYMEAARQNGWLVTIDEAQQQGRLPVPGDLYCWHTDPDSHIGFVEQFTPFGGALTGLSGNTSTEDGGQGVASHTFAPNANDTHFILIPRNP